MKSISLSISTLLVGFILLSGCGPSGEHAVEPVARDAEKALVKALANEFERVPVETLESMTAKASKAARKTTLDRVDQGITDEATLLSAAETAARKAATQEYPSTPFSQDSTKEHRIIDKIEETIGDGIRDALQDCTESALSDKSTFRACLDRKLGS